MLKRNFYIIFTVFSLFLFIWCGININLNNLTRSEVTNQNSTNLIDPRIQFPLSLKPQSLPSHIPISNLNSLSFDKKDAFLPDISNDREDNSENELRRNHIFQIIRASDLIVDGETIIISTSETYGSVTVKNGGNLTIIDTNVKIENDLTIQGNSFVEVTSTEIDGSILIKENSELIGSLDTSSDIANIDSTDSNIDVTSTSTVYYPFVDGLTSVNSTIGLEAVLNGMVMLTNSSLLGTMDQYYGYAATFTATNSDVDLVSSSTTYYPFVDGLTSVNSTIGLEAVLNGMITLTNSSLLGTMDQYYGYVATFTVTNSDVDLVSSSTTYYPFVDGLTSVNSTIGLEAVLNGMITLTNSSLLGT
ncbi:MAG: hypothetical protein ACFFC7_27055, partial [Candidatus Hermodarchaeota archaeon]